MIMPNTARTLRLLCLLIAVTALCPPVDADQPAANPHLATLQKNGIAPTLAGVQLELGPDCGTVAVDPGQRDAQPGALLAAARPQQPRRPGALSDHQVEVAVAVDVAGGQRAERG